MSNCDEYELLLSARLDGELSPGEIDRLGAHLAVCPRCRALEADLAAMERLWRELPPVPAPPDLGRRIQAAVAADNVIPIVPSKYRRHSSRRRRWAASAAVLAVILLGAGGLGLLRSGGGPESAAPAAASLQTAPDLAGAPSEDSAAAEAAGAPEAGARSAGSGGETPEPAPSPASAVPESRPADGGPALKSFSADAPTDAENSLADVPGGDAVQRASEPSVVLAQALSPQAEALSLCARQLFPEGETDADALSGGGENTLTLLLPDGSRVVLTCGAADEAGRYPVTCQSGDAATLYRVDLDDGSVTPEEP